MEKSRDGPASYRYRPRERYENAPKHVAGLGDLGGNGEGGGEGKARSKVPVRHVYAVRSVVSPVRVPKHGSRRWGLPRYLNSPNPDHLRGFVGPGLEASPDDDEADDDDDEVDDDDVNTNDQRHQSSRPERCWSLVHREASVG